jgi:hypothetical protein
MIRDGVRRDATLRTLHEAGFPWVVAELAYASARRVLRCESVGAGP